ncbi:hypothetical protein L2E82_50431 [Cichorium intybus]|nr:hypothetical protein L2E82_50431 [Cichorium intybus]
MRVHKLDHPIRCSSNSRDNVTKRRTNSKFSVNAFSGWSGDDNGSEVLNESPPKKSSNGGIVGAAVAGVVLVAGLSFATLSISKRVSGTKKTMETMTTHQEESLTSADQNDDVESAGPKGENVVVDDDSSSHGKENETTTEDKLSHSTQQDFQEELPPSEVQGDTVETPGITNSDVHDDNLDDTSIIQSSDDTEKLESDDKLKEDLTDVKIIDPIVSDVNSGIPDSGLQEVTEKEPVDLDSIGSKIEDFDNREFLESFPESEVLEDGLSIPIPIPVPIPEQELPKKTYFDSMDLEKLASSSSIPAPSVLSPSLQNLPGKVLVPAVVDQVQGQALAALQVLKVIEGNVQPGDLCTRREYARWLVSASSALSRNTLSKVYPAMYIENVTELAFDDITPEDPDFSSIQGLAEAGLIASKLSQHDMNISNEDENSLNFCPESPLSRQDLVSWKMSLEKRLLPVPDRTILERLSGFIDIDKINPDAWPALISDLSAGENGIIGLAFGYTRLFQPDKPVTKAQAAIALATGESSDIVSEELTRIEAESMAEKAVAAHTALVDQVQQEVNTYFEKDLLLEREKIVSLEKIAEETKQELERLKAEQEEQNIRMMKERAAVDSQMEVLLKLRHEAEEELQGILSNKVEISYEKERVSKLRANAEIETQEISRLQYELEVERKALAMARSWAEDEAKRAREQVKVLEDARAQWESKGIKVIVDDDLRDESNAESTWVNAQKQFSIEATKSRAEKLVEKLKKMAEDLKGKSKQTIDKVIEKILFFISQLKELASKGVKQVSEVKDTVVAKVSGSVQELQRSSVGWSSAVKEKFTQKFKT